MEAGMINALVSPAYEDAAVRIYALHPPAGHCVAAP